MINSSLLLEISGSSMVLCMLLMLYLNSIQSTTWAGNVLYLGSILLSLVFSSAMFYLYPKLGLVITLFVLPISTIDFRGGKKVDLDDFVNSIYLETHGLVHPLKVFFLSFWVLSSSNLLAEAYFLTVKSALRFENRGCFWYLAVGVIPLIIMSLRDRSKDESNAKEHQRDDEQYQSVLNRKRPVVAISTLIAISLLVIVASSHPWQYPRIIVPIYLTFGLAFAIEKFYHVSDCIVNWAKTFIAIAGLAILFAVFNHLGGEFPDTILGCFFLLMLEVSGIAMLGGLGFVLLYLLGIIEVGCSRQNGFKILSILAPVLVLSALIVFYYLRTILDLSQLIENNQ